MLLQSSYAKVFENTFELTSKGDWNLLSLLNIYISFVLYLSGVNLKVSIQASGLANITVLQQKKGKVQFYQHYKLLNK